MVDFDPASLLMPDGKLDVNWFAGKTQDQVIATLTGFIDDVTPVVSPLLDAEPDKQLSALEAWGYGQGYLWIATDLASRAGSIAIPNEITRQISRVGPDFFKALSDYWLTIFYGLIPTAVPLTNRKPRSVSLTARFRP